MNRFFKANTSKPLYAILEEKALRGQSIRYSDKVDRLLPAESGSEAAIQARKHDTMERVHGFHAELEHEFEKDLVTQSQVIHPLTEEFKEELSTFRFNK